MFVFSPLEEDSLRTNLLPTNKQLSSEGWEGWWGDTSDWVYPGVSDRKGGGNTRWGTNPYVWLTGRTRRETFQEGYQCTVCKVVCRTNSLARLPLYWIAFFQITNTKATQCSSLNGISFLEVIFKRQYRLLNSCYCKWPQSIQYARTGW